MGGNLTASSELRLKSTFSRKDLLDLIRRSHMFVWRAREKIERLHEQDISDAKDLLDRYHVLGFDASLIGSFRPHAYESPEDPLTDEEVARRSEIAAKELIAAVEDLDPCLAEVLLSAATQVIEDALTQALEDSR